MVTAGGLVFIAATKDSKIRAFPQKDRVLLWGVASSCASLCHAGRLQVNGRQFVVVPCGGGKLGTRSGDAYVAFALPSNRKNAGA